MDSVHLNGRETSCLGFGGALLGSPAMSRRLLAAAYDAGIRHFDVAPTYGFGRSERLLREALGSDIHRVTVTTKYGLNPPAHSHWMERLYRAARTTLGIAPGLRRKTEQAGPQPVSALTAEGAALSLATSLRAFGIDSIDLFLLHEATPARLAGREGERLLDLLDRYRKQGRIRGFGVGSRSDRAAACLAACPAFCDTVQYEWSVFSPPQPVLSSRPHITHGSLGTPRQPFLDWLLEDRTRCRRWSQRIDLDLLADGTLSRLLLKAALLEHAGSIVLFSARSEANILANAAIAEDSRLVRPAATFLALVRAEYLPVASMVA